MLGSLLNRPLEIDIDGRMLRFGSKADFEFALASRTEVPAEKIAELMRFDTAELTEEASSIRHVERHFVDLLSQSIQEPGSIGYLLREMDMKMFSQDHDWRSIMQSVARQPARFNDYKQLAMVKYMQYLASRQDVLKGIFAFKAAGGATEPAVESPGGNQFRETVIFDISESPLATRSSARDSAEDRGALTRLPRGEAVTVTVPADAEIAVVLSRYAFTLRLGEEPSMVGQDGRVHALARGRNVVGRHPDSDVLVDAAHRDVSRTHLLVEIESADAVRLTDLSSHGTFIASDLLQRNATG